jgi:hypothetical protein
MRIAWYMVRVHADEVMWETSVFVTNSRAVAEILMTMCTQLCMAHIEKWTYTLAREIENRAFLTHAENDFPVFLKAEIFIRQTFRSSGKFLIYSF